MMTHTRQQIVKYILFIISRNKANQAMKFGQLMKYYKKSFFLQKAC